MIKIAVPDMTTKVVDRAIQAHGGMGVCQDTPLAEFWIYGRTIRIADGPDEVAYVSTGKKLGQGGVDFFLSLKINLIEPLLDYSCKGFLFNAIKTAIAPPQ